MKKALKEIRIRKYQAVSHAARELLDVLKERKENWDKMTIAMIRLEQALDDLI